MNKRLYVGNLGYSTTNEDLEKLFSSEGIVTSAKVIRSMEGKSKGFGFVEMETEEEKWSSIWNNVKIKVDSLTEFYKRHPIKGLDADSIKDDPLIEEN